MSAIGGPNIVEDGLVLALDAANIKSFRGIPTTNLIADASLSVYNNVSGDVSITLESTSETYKGATVWIQTITPLNASGVSYLSNGNNPGIGTVISGAGGGLANRYTGHSIFFKPTVSMHSSPIYTQYSNIPGYQSSTNYDDMGDGWFRAHVIWYDTVTRTDGKYWAINPQSATIGVPIIIYWVGPFKEDRNDSQIVAPFVNGTRGTTVATGGGWADRSGNSNHGELVNGPTFSSANLGSISFDGVDDTVNMGIGNTFFPLPQFTINVWFRSFGTVATTGTTPSLYGFTFGIRCIVGSSSLSFSVDNGSDLSTTSTTGNISFRNGDWYNCTMTHTGTVNSMYINGQFNVSVNRTWSGTSRWPTNGWNLGRDNNDNFYFFSGQIPQCQIYNRALTASEIQQNYNATKGRFGL